MEEDKKDAYKVSDLRLAAFLKIKGFRLIRIDRSHNDKGIFVFEDQPNREKLIMDFLNQETSVEPIGYIEVQRNLKGACRGG